MVFGIRCELMMLTVSQANFIETACEKSYPLCGDFAAHLIHVQRLSLGDYLSQGAGGKCASFCVDDDLVTEHHQRGDGTNVEGGRDAGLRFGVDFGKDDLGVLFGHGFESRRERATRAAPRCPEIDNDEVVFSDAGLEVLCV